jgi:large subunit ribosomal protein L13
MIVYFKKINTNAKAVYFMDMNKAFYLKKEIHEPKWYLVDAKNKVVGRVATQIANILRGKDEVFYTPHCDSGDYIVVINADKIVFTGDKMEDKEYVWYTGWMGGQKRLSAEQMMKRHPDRILQNAVKGMLPKTILARNQLKKLKIYAGDKHPHVAQIGKAV